MMTEQALAKPTSPAQALERVLIEGDLAALSSEQRIEYYQRVCESTGLNPMTKPFDYLKLNGRLLLYAKRDATDQLRKLHGVSITKLERERLDDVYCVTAYAATADGRTDSSLGAVPVAGLKGEALANAYMKAETKSKRRVTLSICGLGLLDETEIGSIPGALPEPTIVESKSLPAGDRAVPVVDASPEAAPRAVDSAPVGRDLPHPEHAPKDEPAPITAFFERTRGAWHMDRAATRKVLDPTSLDEDLNDEAAVRAALGRFGQNATDKGLERLFTLCTPTREPVTA